jgi:serine/threonine protein kinase/tetratricopeptide (TPR) repeat protein
LCLHFFSGIDKIFVRFNFNISSKDILDKRKETFSGEAGTVSREGSGPQELAYLNLVKLLSGTLINGRYRLEKLIGQGGFGIVFEALDITLNSRVAVKFLNPRLTKNEKKFLRVKREINLSRQISDSRIIKVFSLESWQGISFLVMELAAGQSLKIFLQERGRLGWPEFKNIFLQILEAVDVLHRGGIVHRDLKPANILIAGDHKIKILDFGLAKAVDDMDKTSTVGEIVGSPYYMSPEQIRGEVVDFQSDVYQLGLILYRTLSGRHPFEHTSTMEVIFKQLNQRPERLALADGGLPRFLRFGLEKALEKSKSRRFRDAGTMAQFFAKEKLTGLNKLLLALGRRPLKWAMAGICLALGLLLIYLLTFGSSKVHTLQNQGSRLEAMNRFGVRLWAQDFAPLIVYHAYQTRSSPPLTINTGSLGAELRMHLDGKKVVVVLLVPPPDQVFPPTDSITSSGPLSQLAILDLEGKVLKQEPFLKEFEYENYDYIRCIKPHALKLLAANPKEEAETLVTFQHYQSMYPFVLIYLRGIKKYVFTHPGTFETTPLESQAGLSMFMLFGINNLFSHMSFIAEIGFATASNDDKLIKGIPNLLLDDRINIPYEGRLFILPAQVRQIENNWRENGRARFNESRTGDVLEVDRDGRLTVQTRNGTFSFQDPLGILRRVYTLVNSSYQEKAKKRNLKNALELIQQAATLPLQNPYLLSALRYLQGDLEIGLGRYADGEKTLLQALAFSPGNNDANERLCEMDMLKGEPNAAIQRLTETYSDSSEFWGFSNFGVNLFKGCVFLQAGLFSKAEEEFEKISLSLPELATFCQATADVFRGNYVTALAALRELEKQPLEIIDLRELRLMLGRSMLLSDSDPVRANFLFGDIYGNSLAYGHLAELSSCYFLARAGQVREAKQTSRLAFDRLLQTARGDFMTRLWLFYDAYVYGRIMELAGDRAEAARGYQACIEANPFTNLAVRSRQRFLLLKQTR